MAKKLRWRQDEPGKWTSECKTHPGYSVVFIAHRLMTFQVLVQFCKDDNVMSEHNLSTYYTNIRDAKAGANTFLQHMLSVSGYYATFGQ